MYTSTKLWNAAALSAIFFAATAFSQSLPPEIKANLDKKIKQLQSWSVDPAIIAAVKAHNSNMPAEDRAMTNEKWSKLTVLDPYVRSFTRNPLGIYLKSKKDDQISECFVSGPMVPRPPFSANLLPGLMPTKTNTRCR